MEWHVATTIWPVIDKTRRATRFTIDHKNEMIRTILSEPISFYRKLNMDKFPIIPGLLETQSDLNTLSTTLETKTRFEKDIKTIEDRIESKKAELEALNSMLYSDKPIDVPKTTTPS